MSLTYYSVRLHGRYFLSLQLSFVDKVLVRCGTLCPVYLLRTGIASVLNLGTWELVRAATVHMCVSPVVSRKHGFPLRMFLPPLHRSLGRKERSVIKTSLLRTESTQFLMLCTLSR